jgi:hypothetical protein
MRKKYGGKMAKSVFPSYFFYSMATQRAKLATTQADAAIAASEFSGKSRG